MKYRRKNELRSLDILAKGTAWSEIMVILGNYENNYVKGGAGLIIIAQVAHLIADYNKRQSKNNFHKPY